MGNFGGHALPGSFFILFSIWHLVKITIAYFKAKSNPNGPPYKSVTYHLSGCSGAPMEPILKFASTTIGLTLEIITGMKGGKFVHWGNLQHVTMFYFFGMTGLLETLHHYRFYLPPHILYISTILAFTVEGILFYWHLHGRDSMDVQVHVLLLYVIFATVAVLFMENYNRSSVIPALARSYLILLQGVWFWQVAFIVYPPAGFSQWDTKNHEQMMIVTVIFCAWAAICLAIMMGIWFIVSCRYGMCRRSSKTARLAQNGGYRRVELDIPGGGGKLEEEDLQALMPNGKSAKNSHQLQAWGDDSGDEIELFAET